MVLLDVLNFIRAFKRHDEFSVSMLLDISIFIDNLRANLSVMGSIPNINFDVEIQRSATSSDHFGGWQELLRHSIERNFLNKFEITGRIFLKIWEPLRLCDGQGYFMVRFGFREKSQFTVNDA